MSEARITEQLRLRLDEVEFVYHHLPKTLERAQRASRGEPWNVFFRDQALALRSQREALRSAAERWGMHTRPHFSAAVEEHLNEARLAVMAKPTRPAMERTVHAVLNALRERIVHGLEEAVQLARRIKERDLAQRLRSLLKDERSQQPAQQKMPT